MDGLRPPDDPGTRRHHQPGLPAVEGRTVRNAPRTTAGRHAISAGRHCTRVREYATPRAARNAAAGAAERDGVAGPSSAVSRAADA
ncbi:hypothetical protein C7S13_4427 [Burkholderia cepacia]|nr:hypothetical protein [Burkholderia cepacia]